MFGPTLPMRRHGLRIFGQWAVKTSPFPMWTWNLLDSKKDHRLNIVCRNHPWAVWPRKGDPFEDCIVWDSTKTLLRSNTNPNEGIVTLNSRLRVWNKNLHKREKWLYYPVGIMPPPLWCAMLFQTQRLVAGGMTQPGTTENIKLDNYHASNLVSKWYHLSIHSTFMLHKLKNFYILKPSFEPFPLYIMVYCCPFLFVLQRFTTNHRRANRRELEWDTFGHPRIGPRFHLRWEYWDRPKLRSIVAF